VNLIPDWRQAHKFWSMRWAIVTAFLAGVEAAYMILPSDWLPAIPDHVKAGLSAAVLFSAGATGVARLLKQPDVSTPTRFDGGQT
jgi:uncharacterized BrkB/YihY/UPF0761 family membrane protein